METYPFLQKNLEALARAKAPVARWLSAMQPDVEQAMRRVVRNEGGLWDWELEDGGTLFTRMPPVMLYRDWLPSRPEDVKKSHASATFIVGANLGYGLNHVLANTPNGHRVFVLEPDPMLLLGCLGQTDYTPFFEIGKLTFLAPDEELIRNAVQTCDVPYFFGRIYLRQDLPCQQISPQYARWGVMVRKALENLSVELMTLRKRQDVMVGNELSNFQRAMDDGSLRRMQGAGQGVSAVLLGAGPSLAAFAPQLAGNMGRALRVTALQTMPVLQQLGIKPHLCMAIDFNEGMNQVYERMDPEFARDVPLLYSTKIHPDVLRRYPGPTVPFWTMGGVASYVMRDEEYVLDAGGNVSVALERFLQWCGVSDILLVGQDFAWKGDRTHAAGHHAAKQAFKAQPGKFLELKDRDGGLLYSSLPYVTALRDMERDIETGSTRFHNLYGGGAVINGAAMLDVDKAVAQGLFGSAPGSLERFFESLDRARQPRRWPHFEPRAQTWGSSLRSVKKRLEKLFKKAGKNQEEIHATFQQVVVFLKQDPLYLPYLYNEIMDVTGLARAHTHYGMPEIAEFRRVLKRVQDKVRHIDEVLAPPVQRREEAA